MTVIGKVYELCLVELGHMTLMQWSNNNNNNNNNNNKRALVVRQYTKMSSPGQYNQLKTCFIYDTVWVYFLFFSLDSILRRNYLIV